MQTAENLHSENVTPTFGGLRRAWHSKREESFSHLEGYGGLSASNVGNLSGVCFSARATIKHRYSLIMQSTYCASNAQCCFFVIGADGARAQCCAQARRHARQVHKRVIKCAQMWTYTHPKSTNT